MKYTLRLLLTMVLTAGGVLGSFAQVITTFAGTGSFGHTGDGGPATLADFLNLSGVSVGPSGDVYVSDVGAPPFSVTISIVRKIDHATRIVSTIAGRDTTGYTGDGLAATSELLNNNWGTAFDASGNLCIADQINHRIRKVTPGGFITTIGGNGDPYYNGDGLAAVSAAIGNPIGIAIDHSGNIYFSDHQHYVIRMINTSGIVSTIAGTGSGPSYTGDNGPAVLAGFSDLFGIAVDAAGNIYICDAGNNCIRKVNTSGIITTFAGTGVAGYNADGIAATNAELNFPTGVCVDGAGNVYIADAHNNRVRKVNAAGIISTVAGNGVQGSAGDLGQAILAQLYFPSSVAMDAAGNLFITDLGNSKIREVSKDLTFKLGNRHSIDVCQDAGISIDSILGILDLGLGFTDVWSLADSARNGIVYASYSDTSTAGISYPSGLSYTPRIGFIGNDSFKVRVANGIDSSIITIYVNVIPLLTYAGVINGPSYVCVNDTVTVTDSIPGGVWSITNTNASVLNGVVRGNVPGSDTIVYKISNQCSSASTIKPIAIFPQPSAGHISGPLAICLGSTVSYLEDVPGGSWNMKNLLASVSAAGNVTAIHAGVDTIVYKVHDAFCTGSSSFRLQIDSFPYGYVLPADTMVCAGATFNLADSPVNGIWSVTNGNIAVSPGTASALSPGIDTINYLITNSCGTATVNSVVTVNPTPAAPVISENGNTVIAPSGYSVYQWLLNGAPIPGAIGDSFLVSVTGLYSVFIKNEFGCAATSPATQVFGCTPADILVYPNPAESTIYIKWCKNVNMKLICDDGKVLESATGTNQLDISGLPNADYLLVLYDEDGNKIKSQRISKVAR